MKNNKIIQSFVWIMAIAAFAGSLTWTYISINQNSDQSLAKEVALTHYESYEIKSQRSSSLWPAGTVLESGLASYFYVAEPLVTITPTLETSSFSNGTLKGTLKSKVALQALNDKEVLYWSYPIKVSQEETFNWVGSQTGAEASFKAQTFSVDVKALYEQVQKISQELQFQTAVFQISVTTEGVVEGTVSNQPVKKDISNVMKLTLQPSGFSLPQVSETKIKLVLIPSASVPSLLDRIGSLMKSNPLPLVLDVMGLLLIVLAMTLSRKKSVKAAMEHKKYKEWITEGHVDIKNRLNINVFSLAGLVDLAIDLDKRVIYDSKVNLYVVLTEDLVYTFTPENKSASLDQRPQLGKLLLERGLISPEQLETGLYYQNKFGSRLGESLIALGFIDETTLYSTLASQQGYGYYEMNVEKETFDLSWLDQMDLHKAKALQALPLGLRADGQWVIVCSEPSKEGTQNTLKEVFGEGGLLLATRPSALYDILEMLSLKEHQKANQYSLLDHDEPKERLTEQERQQFIQSYLRGILETPLLLKAAGIVDPLLINQKPAEETLSSWLVNKNYMQSEMATLVKGLERALQQLEWQDRKSHVLPDLLTLLQRSHFLTDEMIHWVKQEATVQNTTIEAVMVRNHITSPTTLEHAKWLLDILENLIASA